MAVVTSAVDLAGLRGYSLKNPIKFEHKYGKVDFNNVPPQFNTVGGIALYKGFVAKERARRDLVLAQNPVAEFPEITPWIFYKPVPKPVEVVASTEADTVGTNNTTAPVQA